MYTTMHTHAHACPAAGSDCSPHCSTGAACRHCSPCTCTPRLQSQSARMHMCAHSCTRVHMCVHAQPGLQPRSTRTGGYGHARTCMYTYTHTEDHFPLSRLKLHPPQHTGPCHRGHTGDTRGTCWGRRGDTWGTCLSAELRSGTHKHTRGEIPLHPALREHQGAPVPGARVTLAVPPPRCGTGEARLRSLLCHGSHRALPAAVPTRVCTGVAVVGHGGDCSCPSM